MSKLKELTGKLREYLEQALRSGGVLAEADEAERRMKICEDCPEFMTPMRMCGICSCFMDVKVRIKNSVCPDSKW